MVVVVAVVGFEVAVVVVVVVIVVLVVVAAVEVVVAVVEAHAEIDPAEPLNMLNFPTFESDHAMTQATPQSFCLKDVA